MAKRFTYKEFTLLAGIVVALIVVFTLWIRQPANFSKTSDLKESLKIQILKKGPLKNYINAFEALLSDQNNPY